MDNISNNQINFRDIPNDKIVVKASDIIKKLRSPKDRHNFALENSNQINII